MREFRKTGKFMKLGAIAKAYETLKGKPFPGAEVIPEDEWTGFTQEQIPWLDLSALDELFRKLRNDSGRAFDVLPVTTTENGYAFSGGSEEWNDFRMMALNLAQFYHEDWYAMALEAAVSEEMQEFAGSYEDAFMAFNEMEMNNAGLMTLLRDKYPRTMEDFTYSMEYADGVLSTEFSCSFADEEDVWVIEDHFTAEEIPADEADEESLKAPESFGSGEDFFLAMILRQSPEKLWEDAEEGEDE